MLKPSQGCPPACARPLACSPNSSIIPVRVTTGYTEMRTTNPVTIERHALPGEESGDTAWFQRQNPFGQREALRPVAFKRCRWPHLPDGAASKRPTYTYPHILPAGHERLAFYEPLARGDRLDLNAASWFVSCACYGGSRPGRSERRGTLPATVLNTCCHSMNVKTPGTDACARRWRRLATRCGPSQTTPLRRAVMRLSTKPPGRLSGRGSLGD